MSLLPIHHTFGPMVTRSQIARALLLQFTPWKWKTGKETGKLQEELQQKYNQDVYLFDCGRMALYSALKTLDIQPGEEIIIQAYTCIVVPNAITAIGGTPVYVDIDPETLNFEYDKIEAAITNRTRAIIAQHTFGIHSDLTRLREICDKHNIALIEDCAHILDNSVAQQGDISIISFGRDKAVSGVTGGAVLTKHELLSHRLKTIEKSALHHTNWQILQWISYPLRYQFAKWIWVSQLGKAYLKLLQKLGWLPPVLTSEEKDGHAKIVPYALPNGCAALALKQLKNLDSINTHRKAIAEIYSQRVDTAVTDIHRSPAPQKYPVLTPNSQHIRQELKKKNIHLDDGWSLAVVNPATANSDNANYTLGSCPNAERIAETILSLPTHPTMTKDQAKHLIDELEPLLENSTET